MRRTTKDKSFRAKIGMPQTLLLQQYGSILWNAFGEIPYHVGSSLTNGEGWRDVDVRVILDDHIYERDYGDPKNPHLNPRWTAMVVAFSLLGKHMTGLPIDFQIQGRAEANKYREPRSALGLVPERMKGGDAHG